MMMTEHVLLGLSWILYGVLHSVLASTAVKKSIAGRMKDAFKYYRIAYTIFAFLGLVVLIVWMLLMESPVVFPVSGLLLSLGAFFAIAGLLLMLICIRKYFFSLSGIKTLVEETHHPELVVSGVHRYVRHPLYLGTFAFIWGLFLLLPFLSLLITNIVITVYTIVGMRFEEKKLLLAFGDAYANYMQNVRALLPLPKKRRITESNVQKTGFAD